MARLLLVEDDRDNRRLLQAMLLKLGHAADAAPDGETALRMLGLDGAPAGPNGGAAGDPGAPPAYDAVLLDVKLPGIDGLEVVRRLRAAGRREPVVAVTALALPGDRERCLAAGCDGYLAKPVTVELLRRELGRFLPDGGVTPGD